MNHIETFIGPDGNGEGKSKFDANSFLEFLRRSHPRWFDAKAIKDNGQQWVYRGHQKQSYKLLPSAAREGDSNKLNATITFLVKKLAELKAFEGREDHEKKRKQLAYVLAYSNAMKCFCLQGHNWGFFDSTLDGFKSVDFAFNLFDDDFLKRAIKRWSPPNDYCFRLLGTNHDSTWYPKFASHVTGLAQHHGIPTFLLDWTENPWIAAHFASAPTTGVDEDICVWALNLQATEDYEAKNNFAMCYRLPEILSYKPSKSNNRYLASQSGIFTHVSAQSFDWNREFFYPDLESVVKDYSGGHLTNATVNWSDNGQTMDGLKDGLEIHFPKESVILRKMVLDKKHLPALRKLLRIEGISQALLMPTLDNLATDTLSISADEMTR
jgi:FRG domain